MTTRPNPAFSSFTASAKQLTQVRVSWNVGRLFRIASIQESASGQLRVPSMPLLSPGGTADDAQASGQDAASVTSAEDAVPIAVQIVPRPLMDLLRRPPGQLVLPHDLGHAQPVAAAVAEQFLRRFDRERKGDGGGSLVALALLQRRSRRRRSSRSPPRVNRRPGRR